MDRIPRGIVARAVAIATLLLLLLASCAPRRPAGPWQAVEIPTDADFPGLWFTDSLNGWLTGSGWAIDGGIVGRTRDGGKTWRFESGIVPGAGKGAALGRVQFRDSLRGCAGTAQGAVLVTADGGATWRPVRVQGPGGGALYDIQFVDGWTGWVAGTRIARTEDGGETWHTRAHGTSENGYRSANAIHFLDGSRGWLVGRAGSLMRTDDGGRTWEPVALPLRAGEQPSLRDITFSGPTHGWAAGERGAIFHTRDGGATWERQERGVPIVRVPPRGEPPRPRDVLPELDEEPDRLSVTAIQFADPLHGWAVGHYADVAESVVLRTADGGATWAVEHVQPGELLRSLFVLDREHAWAAGDRGRIRPQVVLRYTGAAR